MTSQWYLNAYAVLMCFAPIVNCVYEYIEKMALQQRKKILVGVTAPLLLCTFGWSFATTLPYIGKYLPHTSGLTAYSFLTLLGAYAAARTLHILDDDGKLDFLLNHRRWLFMGISACLVMCAVGFNDYNSPFALILAGGVLLLLKDQNMPIWVERICVWLCPSLFSVYLIHSHGYAWGYLKEVQDWLLSCGIPLGIAYLFTAIVVFIVCLLADLPRRAVVILLNKVK